MIDISSSLRHDAFFQIHTLSTVILHMQTIPPDITLCLPIHHTHHHFHPKPICSTHCLSFLISLSIPLNTSPYVCFPFIRAFQPKLHAQAVTQHLRHPIHTLTLDSYQSVSVSHSSMHPTPATSVLKEDGACLPPSEAIT